MVRLQIVAVLLTFTGVGLVHAHEPETMLVTAEEAARPEVRSSLAAASNLTRGLFPGPAIKLTIPDEAAASQPLKSPFRIKIDFVARNQSVVDPSSARLIYLKSPAINLTPRIESSVTSKGIDIASVHLPPGRHSFLVSLADSNGNRGASSYTLIVAR